MGEESKTISFRVVVSGKIQGVGFRPFVRKLANKLGLKGQVQNSTEGVIVLLTGEQRLIDDFICKMETEAPKAAFISAIYLEEIRTQDHRVFSIVKSTVGESPNLILGPDLSICSECLKDTYDSECARFQYPFNSCLNCGPRFSIIKSLPYDREATSMSALAMCSACMSEYESENGRREHAQSISCKTCAIQLSLNIKGKELSKDFHKIKGAIKEALIKDQIIFIKGVAGYLLCCNARSSAAIQKLRVRKNRKSKPFAIMYGSITDVKKEYKVSEREEVELTSSAAPIVLLSPLQDNLPIEIKYDLEKVGVFLPSSGLLSLILHELPFPIVATSGNRKNEAILFEDLKALHELDNIADLVVSYDVEIQMPQDDSLVHFSPKHQQKIILRRARGMAPEFLSLMKTGSDRVLAFGSDLKSTFSIQNNGNVYISQFLGDASQLETQSRSTLIRSRLSKILNFNADVLLCDSNQNYHSTVMAEEYAESNNIKVKEINHHEAHFAAVLGENDLWRSGHKILGIIWDGAGLGPDGNIWGGEFFSYEDREISHVAQLESRSWILGDKMSKEPRISALSYFNIEGKEAESVLKQQFTKQEWKLYSKLIKQHGLKTSSMGRLFDAVSCILNLCDYNEFEGQAAILLEQEARAYSGSKNLSAYPVNLINDKLEIEGLCRQLVEDKSNKVDTSEIAYKFHLSLVQMVKLVALEEKIDHLAFSGGVFQNGLLVDLLVDGLEKDFELYFHKNLSPNDENISFGQVMHYNHVEV